MKSLGLLLDFVNVKDWNVELLRKLQQELTGAAQMRREKKGYGLVRNKQDASQRFREGFASDLRLVSFRSSEKDGGLLIFDYDYPTPSPDAYDLSEEKCLAHLATLQKKWRDILKATASQGPDAIYLNSIIERAKFFLTITEDHFSPDISPYNDETVFDGRIEEEYMMVFISGKGGDFSKLRVCDNPGCGKMFLFNRPKQRFCENDCRHQYHNKDKIESGYLAKHQAKGRAEKPEIYLLK